MNVLANKSQKTRIHVLKGKLALSDDSYRAILGNYQSAKDPSQMCGSSTELSWKDAEKLIKYLEALCGQRGIPTTKMKKKYAGARRPDIWASPAQLRMLEGMWKDYCDILIQLDSNRADLADRAGREHAWSQWLHNRFLYGGSLSIPRDAVGSVKSALETMIRQEQRNLDKQNLEQI
jgi:hypothetical protein